jgi:hypothetical protein
MRTSGPLLVALIVATWLFPFSAFAQTREKGPWWPHPIWGPKDEAGATNWITPEKILEATKLVRTGKVYELGHVYEASMPQLDQSQQFSITSKLS